MKLSCRLSLAAVSSLVLLAAPPANTASAFIVSTQSEAIASRSPAARPWAHESSDLVPDPRIRFGTLPNGMRYMIQRNTTPPGLIAVRLHLNVGSLHEDDDQKGLAHFTEHMLFNGTENVPENEMLRILERLGLAFGPDTNASTGFDQTIYQLNLPRADDPTLTTALHILREQVSRALMRPEDIDAERDVIVGEARLRDTPGQRLTQAQLGLLAPGQRLADRFPIGDLEIIRTAPARRFIDFYRTYYRPERATLVAVGDVDPDVMEAHIQTAFGEWTNPLPDGPEPDLGTPAPRRSKAALLIEPGVQSNVALYWTAPYVNEPDNRATRREQMLRSLGFAVLNRRLGELARDDNPPFTAAGSSHSDFLRSLQLTSVTAVFVPAKEGRALAAIEQESRRAILHGFTAEELQRELINSRTALENAVNADNTRQTGAIAGTLLSHAHEDAVPVTARDRLQMLEDLMANLDAEEVRAAFAKTFDGDGPLVLVSSPVDVQGGTDRLEYLLEESQKIAVQPPAERDAVSWPYTDFGHPKAPVSEHRFEKVAATAYMFPNNVRLIVKETDLRENQIVVNVATGLGNLALPTDRFHPLNLVVPVFGEGGLGRLTRDELARALTGRTVSSSLSINEDYISLSGGTRPQDLELQMQLMAAQFTDAALREAPLNRVKDMYGQFLDARRATPGGVFSMEAPTIIHAGDQRLRTPTPEEVNAVDGPALKRAVTEAFAQGPIEITIVGDVDPAAAVAAVARTFGALPMRSDLPAPPAGSATRRLASSSQEPYILRHDGQAEQALVVLYMPGPDNSGDRREARLVSLMSEVLGLRIMEEIREKQALSYSPSVGASASSVYPDLGSIHIAAEVDTSRTGDFVDAVNRVMASFVTTPVTEDELTRARAPVIERFRRSKAQNSYWMGVLHRLHRHPGDEERALDYIEMIETFTAADIQQAALDWLRPERTFRIEVLPKTGSEAQ